MTDPWVRHDNMCNLNASAEFFAMQRAQPGAVLSALITSTTTVEQAPLLVYEVAVATLAIGWLYRRRKKKHAHEHQQWISSQIDTEQRLRIFVGDVGPRAFSSQTGRASGAAIDESLDQGSVNDQVNGFLQVRGGIS